MKDFYNGLFALGLIVGAGACVLMFILLEWFGFEISASSGFLAALLGAFVGGSFTIAAQMMAADTAAKQAKKERHEQSLKIEKAIARSIWIKVRDYHVEIVALHTHYATRTPENSLPIGGKLRLAREYDWPHRHIEFSVEEKSVCLEWENLELLAYLDKLQIFAINLEGDHNRYSDKIRAYLAARPFVLDPSDNSRGLLFNTEGFETDPYFQELRETLEALKPELEDAVGYLPELEQLVEEELKSRFGI